MPLQSLVCPRPRIIFIFLLGLHGKSQVDGEREKEECSKKKLCINFRPLIDQLNTCLMLISLSLHHTYHTHKKTQVNNKRPLDPFFTQSKLCKSGKQADHPMHPFLSIQCHALLHFSDIRVFIAIARMLLHRPSTTTNMTTLLTDTAASISTPPTLAP